MDLQAIRARATDAGAALWSRVAGVVALAKARVTDMIPTWLAGKLLKPIGTLALLLAAWATFALHYENKGASEITSKIEKKVAANAKTADTVRRSVAGVPADRLRDRFTRD